MLLASELLHSPGGAQGPQLMGESCTALGGMRYPTWAVALAGKGLESLIIAWQLGGKAGAGENEGIFPVLAPVPVSGGQSGLSLTKESLLGHSQGTAPLECAHTGLCVCACLSEPHLEAVCAYTGRMGLFSLVDVKFNLQKG